MTLSASPLVTVVIPTLNEEALISRCLQQFSNLEGNWQLIVADGGSSDATQARVDAFGEATFVQGKGSRASLLNMAVKQSSGEVVLILHADCLLPVGVYQSIISVLADSAVVGGFFTIHTVPQYSKSVWMKLALRLADLRSRYTSVPYGDQGLFFLRSMFDVEGGYPEIDLMDDFVFAKKLGRLGRLQRVWKDIKVSGRRMEHAPLKYVLLINLYPALFHLGVSPSFLRRYYQPER